MTAGSRASELRRGDTIQSGIRSWVQNLLTTQRADLADLPIGEIFTGWDNHMVRLGEGLVVRLPRRPIAVELLERELDWMPRIAADTGIHVPVPVHRGASVAGLHDGPWAVLPWAEGTVALAAPVEERDRHARALGELLRRLHVPAPAAAPVNPAGRGGPLSGIAGRISRRLATAEGTGLLASRQVEETAVVVKEGLEAPTHGGPDLWIHGDPHTGNTVLGADGPVLVDQGDLGRGDPASDLGWAWDHYTPAAAEAFWTAYGAEADGPLYARARAWAVHYGLIFLTHADGGRDEGWGRRILSAAME